MNHELSTIAMVDRDIRADRKSSWAPLRRASGPKRLMTGLLVEACS